MINKFFGEINYHGFKGETPITLNKTGALVKTPEYIEWFDGFPFEELASKRDWIEVAGVEFTEDSFFGIEIQFTSVKGVRTINMMQGFTQLLKDMYNLPQGSLIKVEYKLLKHCKSESEGKIRYSIYNMNGVGINE